MKLFLLLLLVGYVTASLQDALEKASNDAIKSFMEGVEQAPPLHLVLGVENTEALQRFERDLKEDLRKHIQESFDRTLKKIDEAVKNGKNADDVTNDVIRLIDFKNEIDKADIKDHEVEGFKKQVDDHFRRVLEKLGISKRYVENSDALPRSERDLQEDYKKYVNDVFERTLKKIDNALNNGLDEDAASKMVLEMIDVKEDLEKLDLKNHEIEGVKKDVDGYFEQVLIDLGIVDKRSSESLQRFERETPKLKEFRQYLKDVRERTVKKIDEAVAAGKNKVAAEIDKKGFVEFIGKMEKIEFKDQDIESVKKAVGDYSRSVLEHLAFFYKRSSERFERETPKHKEFRQYLKDVRERTVKKIDEEVAAGKDKDIAEIAKKGFLEFIGDIANVEIEDKDIEDVKDIVESYSRYVVENLPSASKRSSERSTRGLKEFREYLNDALEKTLKKIDEAVAAGKNEKLAEEEKRSLRRFKFYLEKVDFRNGDLDRVKKYVDRRFRLAIESLKYFYKRSAENIGNIQRSERDLEEFRHYLKDILERTLNKIDEAVAAGKNKVLAELDKERLIRFIEKVEKVEVPDSDIESVKKVVENYCRWVLERLEFFYKRSIENSEHPQRSERDLQQFRQYLNEKIEETFRKIDEAVAAGKDRDLAEIDKKGLIRFKELLLTVNFEDKDIEGVKNAVDDHCKSVLAHLTDRIVQRSSENSEHLLRSERDLQQFRQYLTDKIDETLKKIDEAVAAGKDRDLAEIDKKGLIRFKETMLKVDFKDKDIERVKKAVDDHCKRVLAHLTDRIVQRSSENNEHLQRFQRDLQQFRQYLNDKIEDTLKKIDEAVAAGKDKDLAEIDKKGLLRFKEALMKVNFKDLDLIKVVPAVDDHCKRVLAHLVDRIVQRSSENNEHLQRSERDLKEFRQYLNDALERTLKKIDEAVAAGKNKDLAEIEKHGIIRFKEMLENVDFKDEDIEKVKKAVDDRFKMAVENLVFFTQSLRRFERETPKLKEFRQYLKDVRERTLKKIDEAVAAGKNKASAETEKLGLKIFLGNLEGTNFQDSEIEEVKKSVDTFVADALNNLDINEQRSIETDPMQSMFEDLSFRNFFIKVKEMILEKMDVKNLKHGLEKAVGQVSESLCKWITNKGKEKVVNFFDRFLDSEESPEKRSATDFYELIKEFFKDLDVEFQHKFLKFGEWLKNIVGKGLDKSKNEVERVRDLAKEILNKSKDMSEEVAAEALEFIRQYKEELGVMYDLVRNSIMERIREKTD